MGGGGKENCTYIPANMAEEEVAKLIVGNDSGMCKASFAGDVPRMFFIDQEQFLCVKGDEERKREREKERKREREKREREGERG